MTGLTLRASVPALMGRTSLDQLFEAFFTNPKPQIDNTTQGYPLTDIYKDDNGTLIRVEPAARIHEECQLALPEHKSGAGQSQPQAQLPPREVITG